VFCGRPGDGEPRGAPGPGGPGGPLHPGDAAEEGQGGAGGEVLSRPGRYRKVVGNLWVKEVWVEDRRYVLCYNPREAEREAVERELILESLEEKLSQGPKALVGNRGFRRYLVLEKGAVRIDRGKVAEEARYDGKWVLRTNTDLPAWEVALTCKGLLEVERFFRAAKGLLETRPIFHKSAATICGHIFVSFLALVLVHELKARLKRKGVEAEWKDLVRDLLEVREVEVLHGGKRYLLRPPLKGVAVPPPAREVRGAKTDVQAP